MRKLTAKQENAFEESVLTLADHLAKLAELRDQARAAGDFGAAVAAEFHRGMAAGLYVERKEIMVGALGGLSVEELLAEILLDSIEESAPEADLINRRSVKYHG